MVLKDIYSIDLNFSTELYAEIKPAKQFHLRTQFEPGMLISDINHLLGDTASNVAKDGETETVVLPPVFELDVGVPCVSRTPLSKHAARNVGCVQDRCFIQNWSNVRSKIEASILYGVWLCGPSPCAHASLHQPIKNIISFQGRRRGLGYQV